MSNIPKECIIIGGGTSIKPQISLLQPLCAKKFTILTNYSFKHLPGTFLTFGDREFYVPDYAKNYVDNTVPRHPDIYKELKNLPLIVGINHNGLEEFKLDNTILLHQKYRESLTGIFALKLLTEFLEFKGQVFLIGFDWTRRTENNQNIDTHYYSKQEINHPGWGRFRYYENNNPNEFFDKFSKINGVKIYNVSPESNINSFEKISYEQMLKLLNNEQIDQNKIRNLIKEKLCIL